MSDYERTVEFELEESGLTDAGKKELETHIKSLSSVCSSFNEDGKQCPGDPKHHIHGCMYLCDKHYEKFLYYENLKKLNLVVDDAITYSSCDSGIDFE